MIHDFLLKYFTMLTNPAYDHSRRKLALSHLHMGLPVHNCTVNKTLDRYSLRTIPQFICSILLLSPLITTSHRGYYFILGNSNFSPYSPVKGCSV